MTASITTTEHQDPPPSAGHTRSRPSPADLPPAGGMGDPQPVPGTTEGSATSVSGTTPTPVPGVTEGSATPTSDATEGSATPTPGSTEGPAAGAVPRPDRPTSAESTSSSTGDSTAATPSPLESKAGKKTSSSGPGGPGRSPLSDQPHHRLDVTGALVRRQPNRTGSQIALVGAEPAMQMLLECDPEEGALLDALTERRYLTQEQIARVFYSNPTVAYRRVQTLYKQRGVSRCGTLAPRIASFVGDARHPATTFFLDWNGKMAALMRAGRDPEEALPGWDEKTIANLGTLDTHRLGVNEAWSFLIALARQTYRAGHLQRQLTIGVTCDFAIQ